MGNYFFILVKAVIIVVHCSVIATLYAFSNRVDASTDQRVVFDVRFLSKDPPKKNSFSAKWGKNNKLW